MPRRFFPTSKSSKKNSTDSTLRRLYGLIVFLIILQLFTIGLLVVRTGGLEEGISKTLSTTQALSEMESFVKPTVEDIGQEQATDTLAALHENQEEANLPDLETPIRVQILNGCGVRGIGKRIATVVRSYGFDAREIGNAAHFGYENTLVLDRKGERTRALAVADSFGVSQDNIRTQLDERLVDIDVTLIVGRDYVTLRFGEREQ